MCAVAAGLSVAVALAAFGLNDWSWPVGVPVVAAAVATVWPTRMVVAIAMLATAIIVVVGRDGAGVLFGASVAALMLALNHLQPAATPVRRRRAA